MEMPLLDWKLLKCRDHYCLIFRVNPKPNDDLEIQLIQTSHELVGVLYTPSSSQTRLHNVK